MWKKVGRKRVGGKTSCRMSDGRRWRVRRGIEGGRGTAVCRVLAREVAKGNEGDGAIREQIVQKLAEDRVR